MTGKRFIMTGYAIWDSQNDNRRVSTETAYKLLNELNDENEQLKKEVEDLKFSLRTELAHQRVIKKNNKGE